MVRDRNSPDVVALSDREGASNWTSPSYNDLHSCSCADANETHSTSNSFCDVLDPAFVHLDNSTYDAESNFGDVVNELSHIHPSSPSYIDLANFNDVDFTCLLPDSPFSYDNIARLTSCCSNTPGMA
jgi:hypothetical protein